MKNKIVVLALAASALLAACNGSASSSSTPTPSSDPEPSVSSSEHGSIIAEFQVSSIFENNSSGEVVQTENSKESGFTAEFDSSAASTKPVLSDGVLTLSAENVLTFTLTDEYEVFYSGLEKNALKFASAITADSLVASSGTTIEIVDDGLTAELTIPTDAKSYSITAKAEIKLSSIIMVTAVIN